MACFAPRAPKTAQLIAKRPDKWCVCQSGFDTRLAASDACIYLTSSLPFPHLRYISPEFPASVRRGVAMQKHINLHRIYTTLGASTICTLAGTAAAMYWQLLFTSQAYWKGNATLSTCMYMCLPCYRVTPTFSNVEKKSPPTQTQFRLGSASERETEGKLTQRNAPTVHNTVHTNAGSKIET